MPKTHKGKGSSFERKICRILSGWWSSGTRDDIFWRTSQSGGRATERAKKGASTFGQYGDVTATDPIGVPFTSVFLVELKHGYSRMPYLNLSKCELSPFFMRWVNKAYQQSIQAGTRFWAVVYKPDNCEPIICLPSDFVSAHGYFHPMLEIVTDGDTICIAPFERFLEVVTPAEIISLYGPAHA